MTKSRLSKIKCKEIIVFACKLWICIIRLPSSVVEAETVSGYKTDPVCSESLLCAQWVAKDPSCLHADSEGSDQTGQMPRLICLRWAHTHFVGFVMSRLIFRSVVRADKYSIIYMILTI